MRRFVLPGAFTVLLAGCMASIGCLASVTDRLDTLNAQLTETNRHMVSLNQKLDKVDAQMSQLNGQLEETNNKMASVDAEIKETKQKLSRLVGQMDEMNKNVRAGFRLPE
jgi:peptidoglycan hydrolase CwlO-like protein